MIDLMLDDLRSEAVIRSCPGAEIPVKIPDRYFAEAFCFPHTGKGQAAFFSFIFSEFRRNFRVDHHHLMRAPAENDDPFPFPDHIGGHTDASVQIRAESVKQIRDDLFVRFRCRFGFLNKEKRVMHNGSDHNFLPFP